MLIKVLKEVLRALRKKVEEKRAEDLAKAEEESPEEESPEDEDLAVISLSEEKKSAKVGGLNLMKKSIFFVVRGEKIEKIRRTYEFCQYSRRESFARYFAKNGNRRELREVKARKIPT